MNRRNFFANIIAAICAILWPKKAEAAKSLSDGLVNVWAFNENTDSNDDSITVDFYAAGEDVWRYYDGPYYTGWIVTHPKHRGFIVLKENQNG